jgi:hypothetical protein
MNNDNGDAIRIDRKHQHDFRHFMVMLKRTSPPTSYYGISTQIWCMKTCWSVNSYATIYLTMRQLSWEEKKD